MSSFRELKKFIHRYFNEKHLYTRNTRNLLNSPPFLEYTLKQNLEFIKTLKWDEFHIFCEALNDFNVQKLQDAEDELFKNFYKKNKINAPSQKQSKSIVGTKSYKRPFQIHELDDVQLTEHMNVIIPINDRELSIDRLPSNSSKSRVDSYKFKTTHNEQLLAKNLSTTSTDSAQKSIELVRKESRLYGTPSLELQLLHSTPAEESGERRNLNFDLSLINDNVDNDQSEIALLEKQILEEQNQDDNLILDNVEKSNVTIVPETIDLESDDELLKEFQTLFEEQRQKVKKAVPATKATIKLLKRRPDKYLIERKKVPRRAADFDQYSYFPVIEDDIIFLLIKIINAEKNTPNIDMSSTPREIETLRSQPFTSLKISEYKQLQLRKSLSASRLGGIPSTSLRNISEELQQITNDPLVDANENNQISEQALPPISITDTSNLNLQDFSCPGKSRLQLYASTPSENFISGKINIPRHYEEPNLTDTTFGIMRNNSQLRKSISLSGLDNLYGNFRQNVFTDVSEAGLSNIEINKNKELCSSLPILPISCSEEFTNIRATSQFTQIPDLHSLSIQEQAVAEVTSVNTELDDSDVRNWGNILRRLLAINYKGGNIRNKRTKRRINKRSKRIRRDSIQHTSNYLSNFAENIIQEARQLLIEPESDEDPSNLVPDYHLYKDLIMDFDNMKKYDLLPKYGVDLQKSHNMGKEVHEILTQVTLMPEVTRNCILPEELPKTKVVQRVKALLELHAHDVIEMNSCGVELVNIKLQFN